MTTSRCMRCGVLLLAIVSARSAAAQASPPASPKASPSGPRAAPVTPPAMRWQLPPLVDGARAVVVPVLPVPQRPMPSSTRSAVPVRDSVEYAIRIIVPDTARMAPMPVLRPFVRP